MKNKFSITIRKIKSYLEKHFPSIMNLVMRIFFLFRFSFYFKLFFFLNKSRFKNTDIFKIYWIDPSRIEYCYNGQFNTIKDRGVVKDGDWDISDKKFEENITYRGFKERFIEGKEWQETKFYHDALEKIRKKDIPWACWNRKQLDEHIKKMENFYNDIKTNGYRLNTREYKSGVNTSKEDKLYKKIDEILVSIGRDGQLLFNDGAHRLSVAKILKLKKIPVMVLMRHKNWVNFKNELVTFAKMEGGRLYQSAYHFDLEDIPFVHGEGRFKFIKDNLSVSGGTILDIGANLGYFCHKFEEIGFSCYAAEFNPLYISFMEKLRTACGDSFEIIKDSILEYSEDRTLNFDIVLALNIFHHFVKRESKHKELKKLLKRINCREMFFETHNPDEKQMKGAYRNYSSKEFVNFVLENSNLSKSQLVAELENGRFLYRLY